jgi:repressor LexA
MNPGKFQAVTADHPDLGRLYALIDVMIEESGAGYALQVKGDCMKPGITHGDIVGIKPQSTAEDGDIVVAETPARRRILKRFKRIDGRDVLVPDNPEHGTIPAGDGVIIVGKAVGLLHFPDQVRGIS